MTSIDFRDDEWGRHWSNAPALLGGRIAQPYSLLTSLASGLSALGKAAAAKWAANRYEALLNRLDTETLRDVFADDAVPPVHHDRYGYVRDSFDRRLV